MSKILVQLSGGKDSLVVLYKTLVQLKQGDTITALYHDMGDSFPHVLEFVEKTCFDWSVPLIFSRPLRNVKDSIITDGYPSDIVPIWASKETDPFQSFKFVLPHKITSGLACCTKHLFEPMYKASIDFKPDVILRGSKASDEHVTAGPSFTHLGILYSMPIWDWTDDEVFEYIENNNIKLPMQYNHGVVHSLDCMGCTAWLEGGSEPDRARFTRDFYPQDYERLKANMMAVRDTVDQALGYIAPFKDAFYN